MVQQRSIVVCILLSIITCGIYAIYWYICMVNDLNYVRGDNNAPSGGAVFLLTLVTCGIYGLYWWYKAGTAVDFLKQQRGLPSGSTGILYLVLTVFQLEIVAFALLQDELNNYAAPPMA
jgi:hypothetical protein